MRIKLLITGCIVLLLASGCERTGHSGRQTLLVLDSGDPAWQHTHDYLIPCLEHFGIPFDTLNLAEQEPPRNLQRYHLIILAHKDLKPPDRSQADFLEKTIISALRKGTGLLNFDPGFFSPSPSNIGMVKVDSLMFTPDDHYITALHEKGSGLRLFDTMEYPACESVTGSILISGVSGPVLWTDTLEQGRRVTWAADEWMRTQVLGPLGGLDDCLWRSMVWAARKPFVMRGLPPLVTMRVDDVAGRGELWGMSPLYWIETCNKYGFKPWLGLFIYNLTPEAIEELRGYLQSGKATAAPHAFGRPQRTTQGSFDMKGYAYAGRDDFYRGFYYYPDALPLRETEYDEFIFFDHQHFKPWSDAEAKRGLEAVDQWYAAHQPLPMSDYFIAHWYEMGANVMEHVSKKWGMDFIAQNKAINMPWHDTVPWVKQGPFRLHESPGTSTNNPSRENRGTNPVYYADFTDMAGQRFFNCFTEIRDDAGYEWAPDNDVEATAGRGIRQITRALGSMAMAVLFTHETDYIYLISPENWERELKLISDGISGYKPMYLTSDEALKIVRATRTSQIDQVIQNKMRDNVKIVLKGSADVPSYIYLFTEEAGKIKEKLLPLPVFEGGLVHKLKFKQVRQQ
jgi:hypothetical protein